jgi:hypothetical protein
VRILYTQNLTRNGELVVRLPRRGVRHAACAPSGAGMVAMQSIGKGSGAPACNVSQVFPGGRMISGAENQQTTRRKNSFLRNFNAFAVACTEIQNVLVRSCGFLRIGTLASLME